MLNNSTNRNGCPLPATHFTSVTYNDPLLLQKLNNYGVEVAAHTITHPDLALTSTQVSGEIMGSYQSINALAGIAKVNLTGFRHPFLSVSKASLDVVYAAGGPFQYESSITLNPVTDGYWPYTMDYGAVLNVCQTTCIPPASLTYPGKWNIPMYTHLNADGSIYTVMDPPFTTVMSDALYASTLQLYKNNFIQHYNLKLPYGLYQHAAQYVVDVNMGNQKLKLFKEFFNWMLDTYPDVWFVTNQQMISWIKNPVPVGQFSIPCVLPPSSSSNKEVCNGNDDNADGVDDTLIANACSYGANSETTFSTCFGCPSAPPSVAVPLPVRAGARVTIPDAGCPDNGVWDPVGGVCVAMIRPSPPTARVVGQTSPGTAGSGSGKSDTFKLSVSVLLVMVAVNFV